MIKRLINFLLKILLWLVVLSFLVVLLFKWLPVPFTPLMGIRALENPEENFQHQWVSIEKISPNLQLAVISAEDQNFLQHNGFDYEAIEKAIEENKQGKRIRGASTISQQTAKNVFLWPQRSWVRKGMEVYFTYLIELLWNKERILEVYLNSIEMGKGIYGAEAAAQNWFGKPAAKLNDSESAAIAAILPNPKEYSANPASNFIEGRKQWILRQMKNYGNFSLEKSPEDE